jgi:hypothetical protein
MNEIAELKAEKAVPHALDNIAVEASRKGIIASDGRARQSPSFSRPTMVCESFQVRPAPCGHHPHIRCPPGFLPHIRSFRSFSQRVFFRGWRNARWKDTLFQYLPGYTRSSSIQACPASIPLPPLPSFREESVPYFRNSTTVTPKPPSDGPPSL